jgi:hypothetical protein
MLNGEITMIWQSILKNELVSPKLISNVKVEEKDPHGCCEDIKEELISHRGQGGWIAWYFEGVEDYGEQPIDDITCSELKQLLTWCVEESKANAYIHEKPEADHSRSKAGGPIYYEDKVRPENKSHEEANPYFKQLLEQLEKDCPPLEMDNETNTSANYPKDSSSWKEQIKEELQ